MTTTDDERHVSVHIGGHVEKPQDDVLYQTCYETVRRTADMHHLAYYTDRVLDFALDVLSDKPGARPPDRSGLRRLGRQLCHEFEGLDQLLKNGRTGPLIRLVLRTADAEMVCDPVKGLQFVVGTSYTTGHDYVDPTNQVDRATALLVKELRRQLGMGSLDPGGYEREKDIVETGLPHEPNVEMVDGDTLVPPQIQVACQKALDPAYLHLVAYCVGDEVAYLGDTFDHPTMQHYFGRETTPSRQRKHYRNLSGRLYDICASLNRVSAQTLRGRLKRIVLDVEQGAVFFYRLNNCTQLVGVTLYQPRVSHADLRMVRLAHECDNPHGCVTD